MSMVVASFLAALQTERRDAFERCETVACGSQREAGAHELKDFFERSGDGGRIVDLGNGRDKGAILPHHIV